ncbi:hypothetical protein, partial [Microbacterium sp. P5_E9]
MLLAAARAAFGFTTPASSAWVAWLPTRCLSALACDCPTAEPVARLRDATEPGRFSTVGMRNADRSCAMLI